MRIYWNIEEWWPVILPCSEPSSWPDDVVEVPQEFVERYNAALKEWIAVQLELSKRFHPDDTSHDRWWAGRGVEFLSDAPVLLQPSTDSA